MVVLFPSTCFLKACNITKFLFPRVVTNFPPRGNKNFLYLLQICCFFASSSLRSRLLSVCFPFVFRYFPFENGEKTEEERRKNGE